MNWGARAQVAIVVATALLAGWSSPVAASPVIAAAGDIACDPGDPNFNSGNGNSNGCRQRDTSDLLVNRGLAAVLALGDTQYEDATLEKYQASYDATWGRVKSITHPAVGNHEYATYGANGYFDYFNGVGVQTGVAGDRLGGGHYSFDVGAWHLVALNSNCNDVYRGCGPGSPEDRWLRSDLASHPAICTLAFMHHPLFTSGVHAPGIDTLRPMVQALYDHGVEVLLTGHDHNYERFAPQTPDGFLDRAHGIREFVVGTGGKVLYQQGTPIPNSEVRNDTSFGVLELTLHPTSYEWRFVPASGSTFADSGSEACKAPKGYPRPRSAARMTVRLVPSFRACAAPNAEHAPPLATPSCTQLAQTSPYVTVGRESTGQRSGFRGFVKLVVEGQNPVDPLDGDQADVRISANLEDVRRAGDYTDYTGQLQGKVRLRMTDRANGASLTNPATVSDLPMSFAIPCQATPADPRSGSNCSVASSADAVLAGAVVEGRRSVWEVRAVSVLDGGPDGVAATPDNTEFAQAGLFVP